VVAGIVAVLAVIDAVRLADPLPLWALPAALPMTVGLAVYGVTGRADDVGVALCLLGAVATGGYVLVERRWGLPLIATAVAASTTGLALATATPAAFGLALIIIGGQGLMVAITERSGLAAAMAWLPLTAGVWIVLADAEVEALEAYVAPVALGLLVAGWIANRPVADTEAEARGDAPVGSWVAYAPAIVTLGGTALLERLGGGGGGHALVVGSVGLAAVLAGASRRLAAPLFLGTALLVAITVHESLGVTQQVPTWAWLALGGTVLLAAGVTMERLDTGPVETGRRLVDVVHERFH
jgi:hypothetical protein